jgi:hypothetical protein
MTSTQVEVITSVERRRRRRKKNGWFWHRCNRGPWFLRSPPKRHLPRMREDQLSTSALACTAIETPVPLKLTRHSWVASFWCDREAC